MAGIRLVSRDTSLSLLYGLSIRALSEHKLARKRWRGWPASIAKGMKPAPSGPGAAARLARLRLFGATSRAPVAVPTPSLAVEKEMGTASVAEARSPARRRTGGGIHC